MHLVEQFRHALHFVHDDPIFVSSRNQAAQPLGRSQELRVHAVIEQVEERRGGEMLVDPSRLARAARAEEEEPLLRWRLEQSWIPESFLSCKKDLARKAFRTG